MNKWHRLFQSLEIIYGWVSEPSVITKDEIQNFETQVGLTLPADYKEYCQVFGAGKFGQTQFSIRCPSDRDIDGQIESQAEAVEALIGTWHHPPEVQEIFRNSYLFGSGEGFVLFFFDLRTYQSSDKSCDIYGVGDEVYAVYNLGRSFYGFVCEMCVGKRASQEFPALVAGISLDPDPERKDIPQINLEAYRQGVFIPH